MAAAVIAAVCGHELLLGSRTVHVNEVLCVLVYCHLFYLPAPRLGSCRYVCLQSPCCQTALAQPFGARRAYYIGGCTSHAQKFVHPTPPSPLSSLPSTPKTNPRATQRFTVLRSRISYGSIEAWCTTQYTHTDHRRLKTDSKDDRANGLSTHAPIAVRRPATPLARLHLLFTPGCVGICRKWAGVQQEQACFSSSGSARSLSYTMATAALCRTNPPFPFP